MRSACAVALRALARALALCARTPRAHVLQRPSFAECARRSRVTRPICCTEHAPVEEWHSPRV
eukprot:460651-Pleurochrysis_carterae.AAC.1